MACTVWLIAMVLLVIALKIYLKLAVGWNRSPVCLAGKTAIVTGANTGIGYHTAEDFAKRGARVILACRHKTRAENAKTSIVKNSGNNNVIVKLLDLTSFKSVRDFAKDIIATEERLDILVNNAGVYGIESTTEDGLDAVFQTNYYAPFLLTILLLSFMKKSESARIVNVSSEAHNNAKLDLVLLGKYLPNKNFKHYSNSKLSQIYFTNILAQKLRNTSVNVYSLHPGVVYTEISRNFPDLAKFFGKIIGQMFCKTALEGSQTTSYVSVSKEVELLSGEYFDNCKISKTSAVAKDIYLSKKVWEKTEEILKLTSEEKI